MTNIVIQIVAVFTEITTWIVGAIEDIVPIFWAGESGLTFLGTLAVCGLGMSIFFLVMGIIQRFLHFRG